MVALVALAPLAPARASVPVLLLDGTGWGHGVGLSQWGAEYLARTGRSADEILGTFYPGASLAEAAGPVRVAVHRPVTSTTALSFPQGGEVRSPLEGDQAPGFPIRVAPGGRVRVTFDGSYRVDSVVSGQATGSGAAPYQEDPCWLEVLCPPTTPAPTTTTTAPPPTTAPPGPPPPDDPGGAPPGPSAAAASAGPVWAVPAEGGVTTVDERGRSYRGVIEATGGGGLRLVNHVGVEDYLRGMAEVPGSWPPAAVQAQTIAARTYALRAMHASGELCDDARCQVYVGRTAESAGQDAAVGVTAARVLAFNGALAAAVYSADAGGVSATTLEGFGTPDGVYPYLTTVRYDTDNPLPWHLAVGFSDLAARLGYPGTVTGARVGEAGPSGRALSMVLEGTAGDMTVDGRTFARSLGLRSTRFTAAIGSVDGAPPPPPPAEEEIQLLPDETAAAQRPLPRPDALQLDRRHPTTPAASLPELPAALDPRRHPLSLLALLLTAGVAGAHVPPALARRRAGPVRQD
jgi:stage II sporulation protein D